MCYYCLVTLRFVYLEMKLSCINHSMQGLIETNYILNEQVGVHSDFILAYCAPHWPIW